MNATYAVFGHRNMNEDSEQPEFENKIIKTKPVEYKLKGGLGVELFKSMKVHKNNIAQLVPTTGEEDTYKNLLERCIRVAINIKSENITQSDVICLCTYNHKESCVPFIAATFIGVKVASLDPTLSLEDTAYLLQQVKPSLIFLVKESIGLIEKSTEKAGINCKLVVFGEPSQHTNFEEYLKPGNYETEFTPVNVPPESTAVIFFSSGTTGLPKGICQSHYALLAQGVNMINNGAVTSVSFLFLAPIQAIEMYKAGRPNDINTWHLLSVFTGGGNFQEEQLILLRDVLPGTYICQGYGQTEVAGVLTCFRMNDVKDALRLHYKPSSCGRPIRGIWYKVVDPETEEILGPNQRGELRVKTKFAMNGYYNLDSSESYDSEGWLKTGDIVYYDEDFCFYVVDRIKEMLKYKSWHIAPAMLENILQNHPSVKKAVVIGIPHEEDGDHPMAIILLNNPQDEITGEELEEYVANRVQDRQRLRAGVKFVTTLPLTPSGKVKRLILKKMVLAGEI